jgi:hypothetical protein
MEVALVIDYPNPPAVTRARNIRASGIVIRQGAGLEVRIDDAIPIDHLRLIELGVP